MTRRLIAVMTCLLLVFAAGCDFFAVPSASATPPATTAPSGTVEIIDDTSAPSDTATAEPTGTGAEETTAEATTAEPTPTPTPTPTVKPTSTPNPTAGMIFPKSDTKLILWKELIVLKADKLALARNEIYARAGYKFTTKKYADYYGALSWYEVDSSFKESDFTDIQQANIHLIQVAEKAINGQLYPFSSGMKLDYDQDGKLETLTFSFPDDYHAVVKMKDGSTTTTWNISCDTPSKKAYLGDIDLKDSKLDLFVDEFGPSDDYAIHVAGLKHNAFLVRTSSGTLPGTIKQIKPNGKGTISTTRRMNILMTWYCKVSYKLNSSGKIVFVPQSSYSMNNFKCKTKVAIPLKSSASTSSGTALTVPAGTQVTLVSTDDNKWIKIKAPGGTGWLLMSDLTTLANPNVAATDAFEGLVIAD